MVIQDVTDPPGYITRVLGPRPADRVDREWIKAVVDRELPHRTRHHRPTHHHRANTVRSRRPTRLVRRAGQDQRCAEQVGRGGPEPRRPAVPSVEKPVSRSASSERRRDGDRGRSSASEPRRRRDYRHRNMGRYEHVVAAEERVTARRYGGQSGYPLCYSYHSILWSCPGRLVASTTPHVGRIRGLVPGRRGVRRVPGAAALGCRLRVPGLRLAPVVAGEPRHRIAGLRTVRQTHVGHRRDRVRRYPYAADPVVRSRLARVLDETAPRRSDCRGCSGWAATRRHGRGCTSCAGRW